MVRIKIFVTNTEQKVIILARNNLITHFIYNMYVYFITIFLSFFFFFLIVEFKV